jgi:t-SNARE complex subunit (syntaxin)
MFSDVQIMVNRQGAQLDRLSSYVDASANYTQAAATTMHQAVEKKRKSQRFKWILAAILICILVAVAVSLGVSIPTGGRK